MNEESPRKYRKYWIIAVLALFVGALAISLSVEAIDTAESVNASTNITALQNNDTADRAYVNNTFLPLAGGTMTGSVFQNRSNMAIGSLSFADLAGVGQAGRIVSFFGINRIFNESTLTWSNSSYPAKYGMAAVYDNQGGVNYPVIQLAYFEANQTSYTYWFKSSKDMTSILKGNLTITDLAGTGNAYPVRSDANGKLEVNRTAGAGITMKSPGGNIFCVTVSDAGGYASTAGACP